MDEEKRLVEALCNLDKLLSPCLWKPLSSKNIAESARAREQGNKLYADVKNHNVNVHAEILRLYRRSAAYAPPGSQELALAYGNCSAILVHLRKWKEALRDLDRALQLPASDIHVVKYLCRKVECQAELGMREANKTCEETKIVLQKTPCSVNIKKGIIIRLVKAIVKLENREYDTLKEKQKYQLPGTGTFASRRSTECPDATNAIRICYDSRRPSIGRHVIANRSIGPGEIIFVGKFYVACPMETHLHSNCSHCMRFIWDGIPCTDCVYAIYCTETCRDEAREHYHDLECRIIGRIWKVYDRMNVAKLLSIRLLIKALREAGGLEALKKNLEEIDICTDYQKRGFSREQSVFVNNYRSAYSLEMLARKKSVEELDIVSNDSAVLLYLLAKHTSLFRKYFYYENKDLMRSKDALFVGKILSHYQHLILLNAITVKDAYTTSFTNWSWENIKEENYTGVYLSPFLSLLNHSCYPNVAKCETEDGSTILYSIRPIADGEQVFDCYGPMYSEMITKQRQEELLQRFYFNCHCIACEEDWPIFMHLIRRGITFSSISYPEIEETNRANEKCNKILESLKDEKIKCDPEAIRCLTYSIVLTLKYCRLPNWRISSLTATLISVFNTIYGYLVNIPEKCL